jgi:archaellum biogenesis ATPase FlaH
MNVVEELKINKVILLLVSNKTYAPFVIDTLRQLEGKKICYVSLNKTCSALKELFVNNNISLSNVVFIDAISQTIQRTPSHAEQCYFISSPGALTELSIVINKFLQHDFDYLIFDSLTNILTYHRQAPVARFIALLTNKIKTTKTKAIIFALSSDENEGVIKESGMFVDRVMEI